MSPSLVRKQPGAEFTQVRLVSLLGKMLERSKEKGVCRQKLADPLSDQIKLFLEMCCDPGESTKEAVFLVFSFFKWGAHLRVLNDFVAGDGNLSAFALRKAMASGFIRNVFPVLWFWSGLSEAWQSEPLSFSARWAEADYMWGAGCFLSHGFVWSDFQVIILVL